VTLDGPAIIDVQGSLEGVRQCVGPLPLITATQSRVQRAIFVNVFDSVVDRNFRVIRVKDRIMWMASFLQHEIMQTLSCRAYCYC